MFRPEKLVDYVINHWHHATPTDFGALALAVCILGWFISRYFAD